MKLIEALKGHKDLMRKADDLRGKIANYCADMTHETPVYGTEEQQRQQISSWIQARYDILKEVLRLRIAIQKTNLATPVAIDIEGEVVTKTIAEWIHRRKDLAQQEDGSWAALGDKGLPAVGKVLSSANVEKETKIRRYYDPRKRDEMRSRLAAELSRIDARLEVVNAVTDLIED